MFAMEGNNNCPECGSTKRGEAIWKGYAKLLPVDKTMSMGSNARVTLCTDCGNVLSIKAEKPKKFR